MLSNQFAKKLTSNTIRNIRSKSNGGVTMNMNKCMATVNRYGAFRASLAMKKPQQSSADNFVNGTSAVYVDHIYE
jgi:hypothetical protein